jgi:bifunctional UDP-N-acetylglucosamine pyrophosphorylase/glucosamine-1-phosphate N-acetyltransferase
MATGRIAGLILAAGKGTRMKSDLPKALHPLCGLPLGEHVGRAMRAAGVERPVFVVGHGGDLLRSALGDAYSYALQEHQLGTGHAALSAMPLLTDAEAVLIAPGDAPLITAEALAALQQRRLETSADCVVATCILSDPTGYGRIIRNGTGEPVAVVEELDATQEQRQIKEVCTSFYCFDAAALRQHLPALQSNNQKGEFYLTDLIAAISSSGGRVSTYESSDPELLQGINDRWQLALASETMRTRILKRHALNGVSFVDPATTYVDAEVTIAAETRIGVMTTLEGNTQIGSNCDIGPFCRVSDTIIGEGSTVFLSHLNGARIGRDARVGPFANLRPSTVLGDGVKIGNYVEVKNAEIGEDASISHLSYIGDASVGARSNIGAGTITCNYDGVDKHRTEIGADAFVGSNSTLIAPVTIGDGAMTAAGSTISEDVPPDALAVGRSRQVNKEGWMQRWRKRKKPDA